MGKKKPSWKLDKTGESATLFNFWGEPTEYRKSSIQNVIFNIEKELGIYPDQKHSYRELLDVYKEGLKLFK